MSEQRPVVFRVDSPDDPRIACYRNLKGRELARQGERFIAEGKFVVRRLLASPYPVESVLAAERKLEELIPLVPSKVAVYAAPERLLSEIAGFSFHLGVLACGRRKCLPALESLAPAWPERATVVVLPEINSTENLGAMLRLASAFGVDTVVLGPRCCDPFYRQSIRVSMGNVFRLKLTRSPDLQQDLRRLRAEWGFELAAAVLDDTAQPLRQATRSSRLALLFGSEARGLPSAHVDLCDRRVTIPMQLGTDSLNVAVAAALFLHHFASPADR